MSPRAAADPPLQAPPVAACVRPWVLALVTFGLFAVWGNSFVAIGYLVGSDGSRCRLDWLALTVARFVPAAAIGAAYCLLRRRTESVALLRRHPARLLLCGICAVPGYNFALYYGQERGVSAPIASLTTTLVPLFVMLLAVAFLGERLSVHRLAGFAVAAAGMATIASAKQSSAGPAYPALIAIVALAPMCWSIYSVLSKPLATAASPVVWTYLATAIGTLLVLPALPGAVWRQWAALDGPGWAALLYLSLPCTVLGFALWTWLLRHLPASLVAFTVFLNPPLTTGSKWLLSAIAPATFAFTVVAREWLGGALALAGLAIALGGRRATDRLDWPVVSRGGARSQRLRWLGWMACANAVLMTLAAATLIPSDLSATPLGWLYLVLAFPGQCLSLALLLAALLAVVTLLVPLRPVLVALGTASYAFLLALVLVDARVFTLYGFHLNGMVWNLLTSGAAADTLSLSWKTLTLAGVALVVIVALEAVLAWLLWRAVTRRPSCGGRRVAAAVLALVFGGHALHAWADAVQETDVTRQARLVPWARPLSVKRLLERYGWLPQSVAAPGDDGAGLLAYPARPLECAPGPSPPNLVILLVDSVRFDMLAPETMPNTWRFSQDAWVFRDHHSNGNATRYGVFTMMYGLYGTYWKAMLQQQRSSVLIDELDRAGYEMGIFRGAKIAHPEFHRTIFAGIRDRLPPDTPGRTVHERDAKINELFFDFLDRREGGPFFGFVFYDGPHAFSYPPEYVEPFRPSWRSVDYLALDNDFDPLPFLNRYKNSVHYADRLVGAVLDQLDTRGLLDETVVVVTGDHGQTFNETRRNHWGHNNTFSRYEIQVPLVIRWPGGGRREIDDRTEHIDLVPTLLQEVLGCTNEPHDYSNGRHLLDPGGTPFVFVSSWSRHGIVERDRIDIFHGFGDVEIVDPDYRPLVGASPNAPVLLQALEEQSRFFARD
jgi:membrane-anchored protein YejM (alkaline phosphatase superfamily)/drug/metabolite transporter (DMT)-like permease